MISQIEYTHLQTARASCSIMHYGAQVMSYYITDIGEILWQPKVLPDFVAGQPIRGGNPLCWPRFGQEQIYSHLPKHGIARLHHWQLQSCEQTLQQSRAVFTLPLSDITSYGLPSDLFVSLQITLTDDDLTIHLCTQYKGQDTITMSQAQHTYFSVGDIDKIFIRGLSTDDTTIDKLVDQIYYPHHSDIVLVDPVLGREITIKKYHSQSTILWNPYDVIDDDVQAYRSFVCIETGNVGLDRQILSPLQPQCMLGMQIMAKKQEIWRE
jgi:glucose-6-phosphate 1-epimerase